MRFISDIVLSFEIKEFTLRRPHLSGADFFRDFLDGLIKGPVMPGIGSTVHWFVFEDLVGF